MATITGQITDAQGAGIPALSVSFAPQHNLIAKGRGLIVPSTVTVLTDATGRFSTQLATNDYIVSAGTISFQIKVPDDSNIYEITALAMDTLTFTPTVAVAASGATITSGTGSPEGLRTGSPNDIYFDITDPTKPILYVKVTGVGTLNGWV